jgi:DNA ligase D-like protein (predicted ligase)
MEPVSIPAPKGRASGWPWEDPGFAFQPKWDGVRMLAFLSRGRVRLQNRRLRDRTAAYPELASLPSRVQAEEAILDGEVMVLVRGRPSFPAVMRREGSASGPPVLRPGDHLLYAVFDLLHLDGRDLGDHPWRERQEILRSRLEEGGPLRLTPSTADGPALWEAVVQEGLEGVVAKRILSPYVSGRSRHWLKVKPRRRGDFVVGGFTRTPEGVGALLCGLYPSSLPEQGLWYVGRVGTGFSSPLRRALAERLAGLEVPHPPFINPPPLRSLEVRWTAPLLTVTVDFAEWTEGLKLRAPSFTGFSRAEPEECLL